MKNPYAIDSQGVLVTVHGVERGLGCNCTCPACHHRLQAHKGASRQAYFSHHRGADCGQAYETALHLLAKEVIAAESRLLLPELIATSDDSIAVVGTPLETRTIVPPWRRQRFDAVTLETSEGSFKPDISLTTGGRALFVEIYVTHTVDSEKLEKLRSRGVGTVEYDFSKASRALTRADLKRVLIDTYAARGLGRGSWIYHPKLQAVEEELTTLYRERNAAPLRRRDELRSAAAANSAYARVRG